MAELRQLRQVSKGNKARAAEKKASAQLRSRTKANDQSSVDKLYRWVKSGINSVNAGFPAQTKGGRYTHGN